MKISLQNYLKYTVYSEDESKEHYLDGGNYPTLIRETHLYGDCARNGHFYRTARRDCHYLAEMACFLTPFAHKNRRTDFSIQRQMVYLPNKSLCDPVRASVNTSTSSSIW